MDGTLLDFKNSPKIDNNTNFANFFSESSFRSTIEVSSLIGDNSEVAGSKSRIERKNY